MIASTHLKTKKRHVKILKGYILCLSLFSFFFFTPPGKLGQVFSYVQAEQPLFASLPPHPLPTLFPHLTDIRLPFNLSLSLSLFCFSILLVDASDDPPTKEGGCRYALWVNSAARGLVVETGDKFLRAWRLHGDWQR